MTRLIPAATEDVPNVFMNKEEFFLKEMLTELIINLLAASKEVFLKS